jgi:hypothetical protein
MPLLLNGMSEIPNADAGPGSGVVDVSPHLAVALGLALSPFLLRTKGTPEVQAARIAENMPSQLADPRQPGPARTPDTGARGPKVR